MKYPRLKPEEDLRKKLLPGDIRIIRILVNKKIPLDRIAKIFKVTETLIKYWTNKKVRKTMREEARKLRVDKKEDRVKEIRRRIERYKKDPAFRKYRIEQVRKSMARNK